MPRLVLDCFNFEIWFCLDVICSSYYICVSTALEESIDYFEWIITGEFAPLATYGMEDRRFVLMF